MDSRQTAVEGPAANVVSDIAIPPSLKEYVPSDASVYNTDTRNQRFVSQGNQPVHSEVWQLVALSQLLD